MVFLSPKICYDAATVNNPSSSNLFRTTIRSPVTFLPQRALRSTTLQFVSCSALLDTDRTPTHLSSTLRMNFLILLAALASLFGFGALVSSEATETTSLSRDGYDFVRRASSPKQVFAHYMVSRIH